jgi:septum formation protein
MRRLILASMSRPRRRLLKQVGVVFRCARARVKEEKKLKGRCDEFVMRNALRKAEDVASRLRSGVVIGADTVVLVGKSIIGKPRSMKDAVRTLRILSRRPQWVYTGIAVVDIDNRRAYTDCEKTKVYMYPLTDKEIKHYFTKISPFDKAGSFDVQGPGSVFIDRVEGCFYNVVGLPLAKLARLLEKTGIKVF